MTVAIRKPEKRRPAQIWRPEIGPKIFDEVHEMLTPTGFLFGLDRRIGGHLVNISACDERLVAGSREDDAVQRRIVPGIFEGRP